jgi:DNA-binding transcriptional MocR family regulator
MQPLDTTILPRRCVPEPVPMDSHGITADGLTDTIQRCIAANGHAPKLLYLVPNCHNPTGCTMPLQRKQEVYAVCQQFNVVILEDDPYALLQFPREGVDMPGVLPPDSTDILALYHMNSLLRLHIP